MSFLKNGFSLPPSILMQIFVLFYLHRRLGQGKKRSDTSRCARCLCVALTRGSKLQYFGHSMRQLSENFNFFGSLWLPLISDGWRKGRKHFEVHSWKVGPSRNKGWGGEGEVKMAYGLVPPLRLLKVLAVSLGLGAVALCVLRPLYCIPDGQHPPYLGLLCTVLVPLMNHHLQ